MTDNFILQMNDITVQFPGVLALDRVRFDLKPGEVHVLLGENGAGKSTIMKVLAGVNTVYEGKIIYKGKEITARNIQEQRERGISIIFQEMNLLKNLTVAENIFLGRQPLNSIGNIDWKKMYHDARTLLNSIDSDIPENALISSLSVGQMQMVEIAKAISFKSDAIIMDEPTSALTAKEVDSLFRLINKLKTEKVAIIYISHRLEEILEIGDRITVFRDGKYIETVKAEDTTIDKLIKLMVGRDLSEQYPRVKCSPGEKLLEVKNLTKGKHLKDISFFVRQGEIVGFYGLMGSGRTETMRVIFGADSYNSGEILILGQSVKIKNCKDAKKNKIALLNEDRKNHGLILAFSVKENIVLANLDSVMGPMGLNFTKEEIISNNLSNIMSIKTPSMKQKVNFLSGGNQQKVVIAKWLNSDSDIIIFDEPTRGIDVGAKVEIYKIMNKLKGEGKAIIMVSSELPETLGVADRIYVMHEGRITKCFSENIGLTEDEVMKFATGITTEVL
ncbi:MAG: sugar ABC transporter ATP-binding protein [Dysgonamonadaceae bacterium]|nr:sugar ABC transporter ATP-binding protein [Dysgonamonadaceae bacterium]